MTSFLIRRRLLRGSACALAVAGVWAALPRQARAEGLHPFELLDMEWADATRQRSVPVRLYLPNVSTVSPAAPALTASGAGPGPRSGLFASSSATAPLVVFSHGIGGSRRGYSYLGRHFARNGVASLHLQHVGSDRALWMGNVFGLVGRLQGAAQGGEAVNRALDLRFALDTLLASPLASRLDALRIVAAGHSYGANTTLLAAGARVEREGQALLLRDERVRAAIVISAPPFYGAAEPSRILKSVTVPSLHVTATEDVIRIPGYYSGAADRVAVFDAVGGSRKWLAVFEGGSHSMFTDRAGTGGVALNSQVKAATQALALAFVRKVFGGDSAALQAWPQQHAGLLARFTSPAA